MESSTRALTLIEGLQQTLNSVKASISSNTLSSEHVELIESRLAQPHPWRSDIASLTGPAGHNPQPAFEKCTTCQHYRLR